MNKHILFLLVLFIPLFGCKKHTNNTHQHHDAATHDDHKDHDHASHSSKEDEMDYGIVTLLPQKFNEVIHTSGEIMAAQGDELTITAKHEGLVIFKKSPILSGTKVTKGQVLVMISGKELVHDNMESTYHEAKTTFENTETDFERAQELNKDKIISDKEFMDIELAYKKARNNYSNIKRYYSSGGQQVSSSISGYIKDVYVSEGQYVTTGEALLVITKNKRLVIKADVPQRYFSKLH
ncbi:MAG: efflux RND transporter periplasmic adaptor subunit, partial [Bacteroidales bacterium]|nr:efflux RND transporter periplasmic adaptor subunit [Bacteroidales bacterium]